MAKFAVYYIPPADSLLYRRGSEILGYDVRAGVFLPEANPTRAALPEFDAAWAALPQTYGFHVTTGYSLYYDPAVLPKIEREIEGVLSCFGRDAAFTLTPHPTERIPFWNGDIVVLHYQPDPNLMMLHAMLTARINPYGTGSNIAERYASADPATLDPVLAARVRQYCTPYMLDGWEPHFTLLMPYTGTQPHALRAALADLFPPEPEPVRSICLLVRDDGETHYRLHREFTIADFPAQ